MPTKQCIPGLVSVVVPTYNYDYFLPQALDSALSQMDVDLEVIVVDDGSTDETSEVIAGYADSVLSIRQDNRGLSAARNAGLVVARGEFIVFLDSDDILGPGVLAAQSAFLQNNPQAWIAVCRSYFFEGFDEDDLPLKSGQWHLFKSDLDVHLCHFNIAPPHALMLRRRVCEETGLFDDFLNACEDHDFWFRAGSAGYSPKANPDGFVYYRRHADSMSRNLTNQWMHDAILHERIFLALDSGVNTTSGFLEKRLACIAGCLLTANRLEHEQSVISSRLRKLSLRMARRLTVEETNTSGFSLTFEYYILRTFMSLVEPLQMKVVWAQALDEILEMATPDRKDYLKSLTSFEIQALANNLSMGQLVV
jgi:glycosyltransferase involved in cell wall biosynthesis